MCVPHELANNPANKYRMLQRRIMSSDGMLLNWYDLFKLLFNRVQPFCHTGLTLIWCALTWTAVNNGSQAVLTTKGQSHRWPWWKMVHLAAQRMAASKTLIHLYSSVCTCSGSHGPGVFPCVHVERQEIFRKLWNFIFQFDWSAWHSANEQREKKQHWYSTRITIFHPFKLHQRPLWRLQSWSELSGTSWKSNYYTTGRSPKIL